MRVKARVFLCIIFIFLLTVFTLSGCHRNTQAEKGQKFDCSVVNVNVEEEGNVIVYSKAEMQTNTGKLIFQNRNDFPVHFCLYDEEQHVVLEDDIPIGGCTSYEQVDPDIKYTVGLHADVADGTEINVMAYDGDAVMEPY